MSGNADQGIFGDEAFINFLKSLEGFEQLQHIFSTMQEMIQMRDQRVLELEAALADMESRVDRSEAAARAEAERVEARFWRMEERMALLERKLLLLLGHAAASRERQQDGGQENRLPLEGRMSRLESSVLDVFERVLPSVEPAAEEMELPSQTVESSMNDASTSASLRSTSSSGVSSNVQAGTSVLHAPQSSTASRTHLSPLTDDLDHMLKAVEDGRTEDVAELLESGVDANITDPMLMTPLHLAAMKANASVVSLLMQKGANVHATTSFGNTPLHLAAVWDLLGQCVSQLIGAGSNVDIKGQNGYTPLHWAALEGNEAAVRSLLSAGANKCVLDESGLTPLAMASGSAVRILLS